MLFSTYQHVRLILRAGLKTLLVKNRKLPWPWCERPLTSKVVWMPTAKASRFDAETITESLRGVREQANAMLTLGQSGDAIKIGDEVQNIVLADPAW